YTLSNDYIKKYIVDGINKDIYRNGAIYSALRAFEKDLRSKDYNIYNSVWTSPKDSFVKLRLLRYLDKNEIKYLKQNKAYHKKTEIIYPLWMIMNAIGIIPLAKEGLITPYEYTAFLVGLGDIFLGANIMILAAMWTKVHFENKYKEFITYLINDKEY
ncbi:MAG: hypothetical protein QXL94_08535, partial [Candidatus Parvarchaeum sp.]